MAPWNVGILPPPTDIFPFVRALIAVVGRTILCSPLVSAFAALDRFPIGIEDVVVQQGGIDRQSTPERLSASILVARMCAYLV